MQKNARPLIFGSLFWLMGFQALQAADISGITLQRDPFQRPTAVVATAGAKLLVEEGTEKERATPRLRAIIYNSTKPLANIDGKFLEVGAAVYDYRLVLVKEQEVILEKNGSRFTFPLDKADH